VTRRCDVSVEHDVATLLDGIRRSLPPLRGIVHAAGVLDDGVIERQGAERLAAVMAPKGHGAWNLHRLAPDLDFFVLFSSAAALLGSPGQSTYAAANSCLGALAHHRRAAGLPATAIDWGPWDQAGMAAGTAIARRRGLAPIAVQQGLELFGRALAGAPPELVVLPIDWAALRAATAAGVTPPLLEEMLGDPGHDRPAEERAELVAHLRALAPEQRVEALIERLERHAATVLGLTSGIDPDRPLAELGLDSLSGVELSNLIGRMVGNDLPATLLFDHPTLRALASRLLEALVPAEAPAAATEDERARAIAAIERLTDDESTALVDRTIAAMLSEPRGDA
jgi:myxalamid-type polyketide synthase MxaC